MSRVGKKPIVVPEKVKAQVQGQKVLIEGPKGKLEREMHELIQARVENGNILIQRKGESKREKALHGTMRSLVANMVIGVTEGYVEEMEIQGVGFRAAVQGKNLNLSLGKSHPILLPIPAGLKVTVTENVAITIAGIDKELVGAFAAAIYRCYPVEPYKGKGVRYKGQHVLRKEGKTAQSK
ncbi:MAG: 50S ribosomal protein L6 [Verrucomicrobiota bacterium]